jgi:hypothetical protein
MVLQLGERHVPVLVEDFLVAFSLPNFYVPLLRPRSKPAYQARPPGPPALA